MSTSIAISSAAATQAAIAGSQAREAKVIACKGFVTGYEHNVATVADSRQYAECVGLLHPEPLSDGTVWILKAAVLIILAGAVFGFVKGQAEHWSEWWERYLMMPIMGAVAGAGIALGFGLLGAAAFFLFTA